MQEGYVAPENFEVPATKEAAYTKKKKEHYNLGTLKCEAQGLISNKKSKGALKFFQTLCSSNIFHFIHLAVFQKVDAQF